MKLLLAEDERSLSKALTAILEHNGYTVDAVYDGVEALEYLEMGEYDGLILDIMMPRMDGMTANSRSSSLVIIRQKKQRKKMIQKQMF